VTTEVYLYVQYSPLSIYLPSPVFKYFPSHPVFKHTIRTIHCKRAGDTNRGTEANVTIGKDTFKKSRGS
jgi:hypothetical protein